VGESIACEYQIAHTNKYSNKHSHKHSNKYATCSYSQGRTNVYIGFVLCGSFATFSLLTSERKQRGLDPHRCGHVWGARADTHPRNGSSIKTVIKKNPSSCDTCSLRFPVYLNQNQRNEQDQHTTVTGTSVSQHDRFRVGPESYPISGASTNRTATDQPSNDATRKKIEETSGVACAVSRHKW
jgi:hypothetical protein